jgi:hypothetical protein
MATVVAATCGASTPQADGRSYVTEAFVLSDGAVRHSTYLAEAYADLYVHLALSRAALEAELSAPVE